MVHTCVEVRIQNMQKFYAISLTNGRPGFDYQKSLNTKISLNIFFVFALIEQRHEKNFYTKKTVWI